jgi:hypothetical protein
METTFFKTILRSDHESPHDGTTHRVDWSSGLVTVWFDRWSTEPEEKAGEYRLDLSKVEPPDFVPWEFCHDCEKFFQPECDCEVPQEVVRSDQFVGLMA